PCASLGQETKVGVDRRDHRTARVQHERNAGGGELAALAGNLGGELLGKLAGDVGEVDAGFFEDATFTEDARPAAATPFALPGVFAEAAAVQLLQRRRDTVLKLTQK